MIFANHGITDYALQLFKSKFCGHLSLLSVERTAPNLEEPAICINFLIESIEYLYSLST